MARALNEKCWLDALGEAMMSAREKKRQLAYFLCRYFLDGLGEWFFARRLHTELCITSQPCGAQAARRRRAHT